MKMNKLKRSHDRKVTNLVNNAGNGSLIQNTFGLPAGKNYSCPGATSICEKVCYAGKLEKLYYYDFFLKTFIYFLYIFKIFMKKKKNFFT